MIYPTVLDPSKVGEYPASAKAGGGFVWDAVLEYRVWCHPERGAPDDDDGSDYYYAFESFEEAKAFATENPGTEEPLALVLQREYIDEPEPGQYAHVQEERVTEWPVAFLSRPQRDQFTIPDFLAPNAPSNRLEILRGLAPRVRQNV
ncbi:GCN5 family acetyltransferase [Pseudoduganella sp. DS3]|uniref:GCN5 family acetyltransferase n=1 Tax=Pseudoduganella guangdongensis TaxID=2692179 RepID=A0A6N9HHG7_9BURK|nr:GCN5 family acetyltransferase [Pseudoduganella guangdongensis]MYN02920.1 GCN5 family acetyltransferase [Pseudoduganella guangdongensis]